MTTADRREPLFNIPIAVIGLLIVFVALHALRSVLGPEAEIDLLAKLGFVPLRLTAVINPSGVADHLQTWSASEEAQTAHRAMLGRFFLAGTMSPWPTALTYAFLHGDWSHLGLNGLWLVAFGTPVARRFGPVRFLAFMAVAAVTGAVAHWACYPFGVEPVIGASAAVSGCMGAAIRFAFRSTEARSALRGEPDIEPPLTLSMVVRDRRSLAFIVVWFVSNALFGIGSMSFGLTDAPVAWQAHVGGFLLGLLCFSVFDPFGRRPAPVDRGEAQG